MRPSKLLSFGWRDGLVCKRGREGDLTKLYAQDKKNDAYKHEYNDKTMNYKSKALIAKSTLRITFLHLAIHMLRISLALQL
jgi:hypothetical protein